MFKRFFLMIIICITLYTLPALAQDRPLSIVAVNFPCFDFARTIAGENASVEMLLPPGSESHSYEPTPQDIISIQNCDLFVYTGGDSDHWIETILASMGEKAPATFVLSESVDLLSSETTTSMEPHHDHGENGLCTDPEHTHEDVHHHELDEHVWTSPKNVLQIVDDLSDILCSLDPANQNLYIQNTESYRAQLTELDEAFEDIVANGKRNTIIFGDRFPFRYFAAAYDLHYDAAFPGCSEDSEPSVRTVISLVDTILKQKIPVIFYIEFSSCRTANILAEETGADTMLFHSCHNVSAEEIESGATYLSLMWQNTQALKEALN